MLNGTYIELQFSRTSIMELVRTSLIVNYPPFNPLLPPTGHELATAGDGSSYRVVQTAFLTEPGAMTVRHGKAIAWTFEWADMFQHAVSIPARRCEFTQRMRLVVARRKLLLTTGEEEETDVGTFEGTLVVDLAAQVVGNVPQFTLDPVQFILDTQEVDPWLGKVIESVLPTRFTTLTVPLPVRNILGQAEGAEGASEESAPRVQNCGVAYTADLSAFAFRMQLGGIAASGLVAEWTAFHAGAFPNRLALPDGTTRQWGVLLSPREVEALTVRQTEEQLAKHQDEFRLTSGVGATWAPQGSIARVQGNFDGTVLVPCRPDYSVTFAGRIEVSAPNTLVTVTHVARSGSFWDLLACEGMVALGTGTFGAAAGAGLAGPLGAGLGFGLGVSIGFVGALVAATVYTPDMGSDSCTQDGDTVTCTRNIQPTIQFGGATLPVALVSATATDDGLLLGGTYALPFIPALRHTILQVEVGRFDYAELPVNCGNVSFGLLVAGSEMAAQFTHPEGTITVRAVDEDGTSHAPAAVAVERTSADPAGVFPPSAFQVVPYPDRAMVFVRPAVSQTLNTAYWNAPYGVKVRIVTPFVTRTVSLGPVPPLTSERLQSLRDEGLRKLNDCLAKQPAVVTGKHKLEWLIDPAWGQERAERLWRVATLGVRPGEMVTLEDDRGAVLATTTADARGTARLVTQTPGGRAQQVLVVHRATPARATRRWDIRVKQIELLPQGTLAPGGRVLQVSTREAHGRSLALLRTTEVVALHDLTFPLMARALLRIDARAIEGAALLDDGLATWGAEGLTLWNLAGRGERLSDAPVTGAHMQHGQLFLSTSQGTLRVDRYGVNAVSPGGHCPAVDQLVRETVGAVERAIGSLLTVCDDAEPSAPEHYTVRASLLTPSNDRRALHHYIAGRWADA